MTISSIVSNPTSGGSVIPLISAAPLADKARAATETPPSTIVTLSAQAQKLSQNESTAQTDNTQSSNQVNTSALKSLESVPKEANEASGIQFMEGEAKGGRISTFA